MTVIYLTKEWWKWWKCRQLDEGDCFATDDRTEKDYGDAKQIPSRKTFFLCDGHNHPKEYSCQKN